MAHFTMPHHPIYKYQGTVGEVVYNRAKGAALAFILGASKRKTK